MNVTRIDDIGDKFELDKDGYTKELMKVRVFQNKGWWWEIVHPNPKVVALPMVGPFATKQEAYDNLKGWDLPDITPDQDIDDVILADQVADAGLSDSLVSGMLDSGDDDQVSKANELIKKSYD